jgi:hypothetical protein
MGISHSAKFCNFADLAGEHALVDASAVHFLDEVPEFGGISLCGLDHIGDLLDRATRNTAKGADLVPGLATFRKLS